MLSPRAMNGSSAQRRPKLVPEVRATAWKEKVPMSNRRTVQKTLMTALVLSLTSIASAHNFPKPQSKANIAAEKAAACRAAARPATRTFARFGPSSVGKSGVAYGIAGSHRFGGGRHVSAVACTRPVRGTVACL